MGATDGISQGILDLRLICEDIPEVIESYVRVRLISVGLRYFQEDLLVAWRDLTQIKGLENRSEGVNGQVLLA